MLLKFTLCNYRSFKDEVTLDLEACAIKEQAENVFSAKSGNNAINILKSIVILGANSAGKSNLFKGFELMKQMVVNSVRDSPAAKTYNIEPFILNTETEHAPTTLECTLMINDIVYRYGFKANNEGIMAEWLYQTIRRREEAIFTRELNEFQIHKRFHTDYKSRLSLLTDLARPDSLFLTVLAQFNIDFALKISNWFTKTMIYSDLNLDDAINYTGLLLANPVYNALFNEIISKADIGFTEIETPKKYEKGDLHKAQHFAAPHNAEMKIKVNHIKYDARNKPVKNILLELKKNESSGSQKLIALLGSIIKALMEGGTLWVDEFDAKIHPYIITMVMNLFNSVKYNPNGAQLIVISYNQQIIKKLRRDQIVFLNKDVFGASSVSALYIFNPNVRSNAVFDKEYLQGSYGGVPRINNDLVWKQ